MPYTPIVDIITHFPVFYIFFVNASVHTSVLYPIFIFQFYKSVLAAKLH